MHQPPIMGSVGDARDEPTDGRPDCPSTSLTGGRAIGEQAHLSALIGSKLGNRYEVIRELGRGGMGVVYLGRDPLLERDVALKLIGKDALGAEARYRFLREARVIAKLDHPGIVSIYDIGEHGDSLFFVMPVVPGTDLRNRLDRGPMCLGELVDLGIQVAEALDYSHAQGVIHRDIKPENILVVQEGAEEMRVRLADFGLAVATAEQRITRSGALVGTMRYVSPEQVAGKPIDARADVYSLGTVLYECVAGGPPFAGEMQALLYRIAHEEPRPLRDFIPDLDDELDAAIMGCLEKDPARRKPSAKELAATLTRYRAKIAAAARSQSVLGTTVKSMRSPVRAPLVGRQLEFGALQRRLSAALAGEAQLVLVGGETGIGKTRLLDELEALAEVREIRVLRGHFAELDEALPYQGFCEIFESHFRRTASRSGDTSAELEGLEPGLAALFPALGELTRDRPSGRLSEGAPSSGALNPAGSLRDTERGTLFELLARSLARIGKSAPLVLLLEDLHAANVSIEALQYAARRLGQTPTLLVGTFTSTEVPRAHPLTKLIEAFAGNKRFELISLPPLGFPEHRELVVQLSGGAELDDELARKLYDASEGNPYFTSELLRALSDSGMRGPAGSGSLALNSERLEALESLPETIQKAVERRVERLPKELGRVLSMASVLGRSFEERELEAVLDGEGTSSASSSPRAGGEDDLDDALEKLIRAGFLEEQRKGRGDRLAFTSRTVQEVLYAAIPRRKRRALHRRIAEALEERHHARLERAYPQLLHHYAQADVGEKVIAYGLKLAQTALASFATEDAIRAAKSALACIDDDADDAMAAADARSILASAYRMAGDHELALKEIEAAVKARERTGDAARTLAHLALAAEIAWEARRMADTKRWTDRGLRAARAESDPSTLRRLLRLGITAANLRGDATTAQELLEEAERLESDGSSALRVGTPHGAGESGDQRGPRALPGATGRGGALCISLPDPMASFDPMSVWTVDQVDVMTTCFETLTREVHGARIVPWLAESYQAEEGGRRFRFRLRPHIRFHDGRPLTTRDVRYSLERFVRHPNNPDRAALVSVVGAKDLQSGAASELKGLTVVSSHEFTIELDQPLPFFPALLSNAPTAIVPEGAERFDRGWRDGCVGTGPFRLVRLEANRRAELQANPDYWRAGYPMADTLVFLFGETPASGLARLRSGQGSLAAHLAPADVDALRHDPAFAPGYREAPTLQTYCIFWNCRRGPLANTELRRAIASRIDVDAVVRPLGHHVLRARSFLPPGLIGHDAMDAIDLPRERSGKVRELDLVCFVHPAFETQYAPAAQALYAELKSLGIRLHLRGGMFVDHRNEEMDLYLGRWSGNYPDPDAFTHGALHTRGGAYAELVAHEGIDALSERARAESDPAARRALYVDIERMVRDEAILLPLFYNKRSCFAGAHVRGIDEALGTTTRLVDYTALWVEEE
jgi:ABC-type transport system substrate-binding protein